MTIKKPEQCDYCGLDHDLGPALPHSKLCGRCLLEQAHEVVTRADHWVHLPDVDDHDICHCTEDASGEKTRICFFCGWEEFDIVKRVRKLCVIDYRGEFWWREEFEGAIADGWADGKEVRYPPKSEVIDSKLTTVDDKDIDAQTGGG